MYCLLWGSYLGLLLGTPAWDSEELVSWPTAGNQQMRSPNVDQLCFSFSLPPLPLFLPLGKQGADGVLLSAHTDDLQMPFKHTEDKN